MLLLMAVAAFMACDDTPTTQQLLTPAPATMDIVSGNAQSAPAGTSLPNPIVVRVRDDGGAPVGNQVVNFKVTAGAGTVFAGTSLTNSDGVAQEHWTLGPAAGSPQTVEARAVDGTDGSKQVFATFSATATNPTSTVASVSVSPTSSNLLVGGTQQLAATAKNADGAALSGLTFTWSSSNTNVATVSSAGLVTARAAGNATISAATGGRTGSATVAVTTAAPTDTVPPGTPGTPAITTTAASADSFSVTASWSAATDGAKYAWRTGANSGGFATQGETVNRSVTFRAPALSNANGYWFCVSAVDAAGNGSEESACGAYAPPAGATTPPAIATVSVSPSSASLAVGATQQLTAAARDAGGNTITGKTFTWSSSNTTVATVTASGVVTARAGGSASISASVDGESGTAAVTVTTTATAPTVATVSVTPASASLTVGSTQQLAAAAKDASGNTISGKTFAWLSSNTNVATVSASGLVTARAAGSATISASVDGVTGSGSVSVQSATSGGSSARLVEDFSTYSSTSEMLQDPRGIYVASENIGTNSMMLDTSVGYGGSSRSMRYTHTSGQTITRALNLRPLGAGEDVWTEIVVRFSPGWVVGAAYKLLHLNTNLSNGARFGLNFENGTGGTLNGEAPSADYDAGHLRTVSSSSLFDGAWHTIRYHTRLRGSDVYHEIWVDGQYKGSRGPLSPRSGGHDWEIMKLGANMNESNGQTQHMWWGRVSVWTTNPGW